MVFFAYFSKRYYFLGLLNWIRIETHYPLVSPLINFYYVTIYFICWCLHCKQQKIMKCHLQIVLHLISRQRGRVFPCFTQCDVFHLLPWKLTHQWRRIDITLKINNYKKFLVKQLLWFYQVFFFFRILTIFNKKTYNFYKYVFSVFYQ